ncbi:DUF2235 domain-containing protein (plasmid) [Methylocystis sp. MJC1]|nr:DUF2235 domain-containing protein [Methylocystis sp. MJC1]
MVLRQDGGRLFRVPRRFIAQNYVPGDQIFLFGFSRVETTLVGFANSFALSAPSGERFHLLRQRFKDGTSAKTGSSTGGSLRRCPPRRALFQRCRNIRAGGRSLGIIALLGKRSSKSRTCVRAFASEGAKEPQTPSVAI